MIRDDNNAEERANTPLGYLSEQTKEDIEQREGIHSVAGISIPVLEVQFKRGESMSTDRFVIRDCPICGDEHQHRIDAAVVLGGMRAIAASCEIENSPDRYYLVLQECDSSILTDHIHAARRKFTDEYGEFTQSLIPTGMDPRAVKDSTVPIL